MRFSRLSSSLCASSSFSCSWSSSSSSDSFSFVMRFSSFFTCSPCSVRSVISFSNRSRSRSNTRCKSAVRSRSRAFCAVRNFSSAS
uniref:Putative secreted protein n=1 Tax=Anopheles darlingi TaxID=43151 RepID=A0A2M4D2P0_ANODA